ncbi:MAG TPA: hypothetical protein DIW54_08495 [Chitinophagaceae bacterium]|nr:hypothetical protein [Chitinophagaceae bacterium]HCT23357.1 hypothetical protein [Chitinophagaceae bacterium]
MEQYAQPGFWQDYQKCQQYFQRVYQYTPTALLHIWREYRDDIADERLTAQSDVLRYEQSSGQSFTTLLKQVMNDVYLKGNLEFEYFKQQLALLI